MDSFSWTDSFRATMSTCLPCFQSQNDSDDDHVGQNGSRSARDELERLLDEPMTDHEAETMSLHSNVGISGRRKSKRKSKPKKGVRVFGIDLFGRRPQISLDDEDDLAGQTSRSRAPGLISSSTLDSDAPPLGDDAIADFNAHAQHRWAPTVTDDQLAAEEAEAREEMDKEMRRERRRQRKETKRLAELGAFQGSHDGEEFEGFPGSGSGLPPAGDEFGPFVDAQKVHSPHDDEDHEEADFGAATYTQKRPSTIRDGSSSGSRSRPRSKTSASISVDGDRTSSSQPSSPFEEVTPRKAHRRKSSQLVVENASSSTTTTPRPKRSKKDKTPNSVATKSTTSNHSRSSRASSTAATPHSPGIRVERQEDDFEGIPGGRFTARDVVPASTSNGLFPSTGFGGPRRLNSGLSANAGVALARRGED